MLDLKRKIADFCCSFILPIENEKVFCRFYEADFDKADMIIKISESEVDNEVAREAIKSKYRTTVKLLSAFRAFAEQLPQNNAFVLHSVAFDIDGVGVAFSALSGTGKSTHLANWYAYINGEEDMPEALKKLRIKNSDLRIKTSVARQPQLTIVNGDKPIVRFFDEDFCKEKGLEIPADTEFGVPYAYGTPWNGKENLGCNMRTPLKHICFIERSDENFVTKIDKNEAVERIMKQVYMPKDPVALAKTLELVNHLINSCELWIIHCNMEPESAKVAYEAIFNNG